MTILVRMTVIEKMNDDNCGEEDSDKDDEDDGKSVGNGLQQISLL